MVIFVLCVRENFIRENVYNYVVLHIFILFFSFLFCFLFLYFHFGFINCAHIFPYAFLFLRLFVVYSDTHLLNPCRSFTHSLSFYLMFRSAHDRFPLPSSSSISLFLLLFFDCSIWMRACMLRLCVYGLFGSCRKMLNEMFVPSLLCSASTEVIPYYTTLLYVINNNT